MIRESIVGDYQSVLRNVGDSVTLTGGAKQTMRDALVERVRQDSDRSSNSYSQYKLSGLGNDRGLIACPVNTGAPHYTIVGIRTFFLLEEDEYLSASGGNKPFCAEYVGESFVKGGRGPGAGGPGYSVVRLVPGN